MTRDRLYLQHIAECIAKIESYVRDGEEAFCESGLIQDAVIRNFEIIGEAAKRLSQAYRESEPEVPWKQVCRFRDVLIHDYIGVDLSQVWRVVVEDMPRLKAVVMRGVK